jgi:hypothetical protein
MRRSVTVRGSVQPTPARPDLDFVEPRSNVEGSYLVGPEFATLLLVEKHIVRYLSCAT